MEVGGTEDGKEGKVLQIDTLLDTGALGVDDKYIRPKMPNIIDEFRKHRVASEGLRVCRGLSAVCTNTSDSLILTLKLKHNIFITLRFISLTDLLT